MPPANQQPNYEFLNAQAAPKRRFSPGDFFKHASPHSLISLVVVLLILVFVILFSGSGGNYKTELDIIARAQEINRASDLASTQSDNPETDDLAATVQASLTSQQSQLVGYLGTQGKKVDPAEQLTYKNTATDSSFTGAAQSGNLDQTYKSYLKSSLAGYQNALQEAYKTAIGTERTIITNAYNSNRTILAEI